MAIFYPSFYMDSVCNITAQLLKELGIKGLILDVDNTLTTHDHPQPSANIESWLEQMRENGIKMIILSNNSEERVRPFAQILKMPFVSNGQKPVTKGFYMAAEGLGLPKSEIAMVGDQVLTDIMGGNLYGCTTFMVEPLGEETVAFIKFKRKLEKIILQGDKRRYKE